MISRRRSWLADPAVIGVALLPSMGLLVSEAKARQSASTSAPSTAVTVVAPATIAPMFVTDLYAKDTGFVSDVRADIGDHVKKGQVLAVIDDPELVQQVAAAEAVLAARHEQAKAAEAAVMQAQGSLEVAMQQLAGLQADAKLMQATLKRQEELFAANGATSQQIEEVRTRADLANAALAVGKARITLAEADRQSAVAGKGVAAAQVRVAEADLRRAQTLVEYTRIVAPFDGIITRRGVNPGDLTQAAASARGAALFTCQKVDTVRVMCDIPESAAATVRPGVAADVRVLSQSGKPIHGTVSRMSGAVDMASRTMRAEIDLPNADEALRPGMYAQVTLTLQPENQRTEPAHAQ